MNTQRLYSLALHSLILLVFVIKSLIPQGFMPVINADTAGKLFPLTICTSYGTDIVYVTADKLHEEPLSDKQSHDVASQSCAFALLSSTATLPPVAALVAPIWHFVSLTAFYAGIAPKPAVVSAYRAQAPPR